MPPPLRRLLNYLPLPHGSGELYVRSTWHKPTIYDPWHSQPPFRPLAAPVRYGRGLRFQRLLRGLVRWSLAGLAVWLVIESARGLSLF